MDLFKVVVGIAGDVYAHLSELQYIFTYPHLNGFFAFILLFGFLVPLIWHIDAYLYEKRYWSQPFKG